MSATYHVDACNALGRAVPKLWRRLTTGRRNPKSRAWEEAYHVHEAARREWWRLQERINIEVTPWFDATAFQAALQLLPKCQRCGAEDSMEHVKTERDNIETHYDQCVVCGYRTDPE